MKETTLNSIIHEISSDPELIFPFRSNDNESYKESLERRFGKLQSLLVHEFEKSNKDGGLVLSKIEEVCESLISIVENYLLGASGYSYKELEKIFSEKDGLVNDQLEHLISDLNRYDGARESLYRMRLSNTEISNKKDMFHIPFDKRYLVKNQRYSIAGLPCLYLGTSIFVCWEEMNRPDFSKVHVSRFTVQNGCDNNYQYLNLAYAFRPSLTNSEITVNTDSYNLKLAKLIFYPILIACSFKKKHEDANFVEEYIIPSLLLQWISENQGGLAGIAYLSNKTYQGIEHKYGINFVFPPTQFTLSKHFCANLNNMFNLSDPVSWQLLDTLKTSSLEIPANNIIDAKKDFISKYENNTKFSDFEKILNDFSVSYLC